MNWGLESYVRLYTRKTADWMALSWQARAIHALLLREADRAGIIKVAEGERRIRLLAGLILMPVEVVEVGVPDLLQDGCLVEVRAGYLFPNFIEAQEAKTEARQRMRDMRERRRSQAFLERVVSELPVTQRNKLFKAGSGELLPGAVGEGESVTQRNPQLHHVTDGYAREQKVTLYSTVLPSRENPRAGQRGGGGSEKNFQDEPDPTTTTTTTTTKPWTLPAAEVEKEGRAVDECGFELRAVDLAQELLGRMQERRSEKGIDTEGLALWATGLDAEALELGVSDKWALEYAMEHEHLSLLEALHAEHPALALRWSTKPRPPPKPPPATWSLEQCLRWLRKAGLKGSAKRERLEAWWEEAGALPPVSLMHAAEDFARDRFWAKDEWPLAKFICEGVWKPRLPENGKPIAGAPALR